MITRRIFFSRSAAAAAPLILPASVFGFAKRIAPSNKITVGMIGTGDHGTNVNLKGFLSQPDARVVAVCDVDGLRCKRARDLVNQHYGNNDCTAYRDFREVIARDDIDAVMVSTPDHWHVPISVMAMRAGKDVISEKPTLTIAEGRLQADVAGSRGAIFQTSTEDRGLAVYHRMAEMVRNGRIGKLKTIRVSLPDARRRRQDARPQPVPDDFDYDLWLGPAPFAPYCAARCHYNFRWIFDYSGGMLTDWGMHLIDTAQWANNTEYTGPISVSGRGVFPSDGLYNTAEEFHLEYDYANGVKMYVDGSGVSLRFEGADGWIESRGWIGPLKASSKEILNTTVGAEDLELYTCSGREHRNFLDCVKSRRNPYFPAEIGHRCATVQHIGNIAMRLGRKLRWDPGREEFIDDATANGLRSRFMREPWGSLLAS